MSIALMMRMLLLHIGLLLGKEGCSHPWTSINPAHPGQMSTMFLKSLLPRLFFLSQPLSVVVVVDALGTPLGVDVVEVVVVVEVLQLRTIP